MQKRELCTGDMMSSVFTAPPYSQHVLDAMPSASISFSVNTLPDCCTALHRISALTQRTVHVICRSNVSHIPEKQARTHLASGEPLLPRRGSCAQQIPQISGPCGDSCALQKCLTQTLLCHSRASNSSQSDAQTVAVGYSWSNDGRL